MDLRKKAIVFSMLFLVAGSIGANALANAFHTETEVTKIVKTPSPITYTGFVTVKKTDAKTGEQTILKDNGPNTLIDSGKDGIIHLALAGTGTPAYDWVALGNITEPTSTDSSLAGEISDCGFDRTQGTVSITATGNATVTNTFTSTCDNVLVNATALFNDTAENTGYFAGTSFTDATLQVDDTIQITWSIGVEE